MFNRDKQKHNQLYSSYNCGTNIRTYVLQIQKRHIQRLLDRINYTLQYSQFRSG